MKTAGFQGSYPQVRKGGVSSDGGTEIGILAVSYATVAQRVHRNYLPSRFATALLRGWCTIEVEMGSSSNKQALASALKRELKQHGFTQDRAAKMLRLQPASLRGWMMRNRFPQEDLIKLVSLAGMSTDLRKLSSNTNMGCIHNRNYLRWSRC